MGFLSAEVGVHHSEHIFRLYPGEAQGIREALLIQGRKMLGPVDERISAQIAEIHDLDRLKLLLNGDQGA